MNEIEELSAFSLQVNLLDRIKSGQVKREIAEWLERLLRRFDRTGKVMEIFK